MTPPRSGEDSNAAGAARDGAATASRKRLSYVLRLKALKLIDRLTARRSLWVLERIVRLKP